ncbi:hypothetical protein ACFQL0_02380 [Haloplanus litoreus]|uniref:Uncharacterized protein n=1 Tax=Haloplanus litoreus TaxID=767515 RepID=A0ABD5ZVL0_9EURY
MRAPRSRSAASAASTASPPPWTGAASPLSEPGNGGHDGGEADGPDDPEPGGVEGHREAAEAEAEDGGADEGDEGVGVVAAGGPRGRTSDADGNAADAGRAPTRVYHHRPHAEACRCA